MREVTLYIAMSLDGFVADAAGGVDWLKGQTGDGEGTYAEFRRTVDTVLMGRTTYDQITTELSPDAWPYAGLETYVFTHRDLPPSPGVHPVQGPVEGLLAELRQKPGKGIWLCGGARLAQEALAADQVDCLRLSVIPTLLGDGIRLFGSQRELLLRLVSVHTGDGIAELTYRRR